MISDAGVKVALREFAGEIGSRVREFEGFVAGGLDPGSDALSRFGNRRSGFGRARPVRKPALRVRTR